MSRSDEEKDTVSRADDFLQMFKKGAEFTQDLLKENERLRFRIVKLEESLKGNNQGASSESTDIIDLKKKIEALELHVDQLVPDGWELVDKDKACSPTIESPLSGRRKWISATRPCCEFSIGMMA